MQDDAKSPDVLSPPKEASAIREEVSGESKAIAQGVGGPTPANVDTDGLTRPGAKSPRPPLLNPNRVRENRIANMMSKAELARRANLSVLTIDRVEKGFGCRMHTKRKILEALGLSLADRVRVFGEEE